MYSLVSVPTLLMSFTIEIEIKNIFLTLRRAESSSKRTVKLQAVDRSTIQF